MSIDIEILKDFADESKNLIEESVAILDKVEGDMTQAQKLGDYGNLVDRIMGGAKSMALGLPSDHVLHLVSDYAALCKAVGYKTSQINNNEQFYDICVALLQDATETLEILLNNLSKTPEELRKLVSNAFVERLRWVSSKFSKEYRSTVSTADKTQKTLGQNEIDDLMKKLGF